MKVDAFIAFLQIHAKNGWVNLDLKKSKRASYTLSSTHGKKEIRPDTVEAVTGGSMKAKTTQDMTSPSGMPGP